MDYLNSFQISMSGMAVEKLRLDVASLNIAQANQSIPPGVRAAGAYRVTTSSSAAPAAFATLLSHEQQQMGLPFAAVQRGTASEPRIVHDPGHPHADEKGNVRYPAINLTTEMVSMITAVRGYEANVAAFNLSKTMAVKALELGGRS